MKTIGKWIAFLPLIEESASGIKSESLDKGTVICKYEGRSFRHAQNSIKESEINLGDKIHFDINKVAYKSSDYWIIDIDYIYGVIE
jgi:hypothetical protein|tara:strand:+ start:1816 stop:2073 length:258 start_codon:yes stop_codon:yes gene_type:complete